jgi:hypothetical protein
LSDSVGIPKGLVFPSPFGISTLFTSFARYRFLLRLLTIWSMFWSRFWLYSFAVILSTPTAAFLLIFFHAVFNAFVFSNLYRL